MNYQDENARANGAGRLHEMGIPTSQKLALYCEAGFSFFVVFLLF